MGTKNKKQNELKREILGRLKKPQKSYSKNELVKELQDMFFNEKYIYMKWVIYRLIKETAVDVETNYLLSHIIASTKKWRIRVLNTKMSKKERSEILWHIFRSVPKKEPLRRKILEDISRFETTQVGLLHLVFWFDKFSESKSNLFFEKARQGMEAGDLLVTIVWLQTFKLYGFADELMKSLMNTSGIDYSLPELQSYCTVFNGFSLKEIPFNHAEPLTKKRVFMVYQKLVMSIAENGDIKGVMSLITKGKKVFSEYFNMRSVERKAKSIIYPKNNERKHLKEKTADIMANLKSADSYQRLLLLGKRYSKDFSLLSPRIVNVFLSRVKEYGLIQHVGSSSEVILIINTLSKHADVIWDSNKSELMELLTLYFKYSKFTLKEIQTFYVLLREKEKHSAFEETIINKWNVILNTQCGSAKKAIRKDINESRSYKNLINIYKEHKDFFEEFLVNDWVKKASGFVLYKQEFNQVMEVIKIFSEYRTSLSSVNKDLFVDAVCKKFLMHQKEYNKKIIKKLILK